MKKGLDIKAKVLDVKTIFPMLMTRPRKQKQINKDDFALAAAEEPFNLVFPDLTQPFGSQKVTAGDKST